MRKQTSHKCLMIFHFLLTTPHFSTHEKAEMIYIFPSLLKFTYKSTNVILEGNLSEIELFLL